MVNLSLRERESGLPLAASQQTITKCTKVDAVSLGSNLEEGDMVDHRSGDAHNNEHDCCCQKKEGTDMVDESSETHFGVVVVV